MRTPDAVPELVVPEVEEQFPQLVGELRARETIVRLFPDAGDTRSTGLPVLDWEYGQGTATAHVPASLSGDQARNVVLAYADAMGAAFVQEENDGRLRLRTARAFDGVVVTVSADVTPTPAAEVAPEPAPVPCEMQPLERATWSSLETQAFAPITDEVLALAGGREHPDASPDGESEQPAQDGPTREPADEPAAAADDTQDAA
jgi:hypothetical protein